MHRRSFSNLRKEREESLRYIVKNFEFFIDKSKAWDDLCRLSQDPDVAIREYVAYNLKYCFSFVPDRKQAWDVLHRLTQDHEWVRHFAVTTLSHCFSLVTDKDEAWDDLHRLTQDPDYNVRIRAAEALGICFSFISDKKQAWEDLYRLAQDQEEEVRCYAYYSLGKAYIFKASKAVNKQDMKIELENAIRSFERSMEVSYSNGEVYPASFCLPFYRSFYTLIFKNDAGSIIEFQKNLSDAKMVIFNSKNKESLIGVIEDLYHAREEACRLMENNLEHARYNLETFQKYIDDAKKLLDSEDVNPIASKLIRNGMQIAVSDLRDINHEGHIG